MSSKRNLLVLCLCTVLITGTAWAQASQEADVLQRSDPQLDHRPELAVSAFMGPFNPNWIGPSMGIGIPLTPKGFADEYGDRVPRHAVLLDIRVDLAPIIGVRPLAGIRIQSRFR